mgnify:FL=1
MPWKILAWSTIANQAPPDAVIITTSSKLKLTIKLPKKVLSGVTPAPKVFHIPKRGKARLVRVPTRTASPFPFKLTSLLGRDKRDAVLITKQLL